MATVGPTADNCYFLAPKADLTLDIYFCKEIDAWVNSLQWQAVREAIAHG